MREPDGFRAFVVARQRSLLRVAYLLTGDWQLAEDLVQTVLVKVWPRWNRVFAAGDPYAYVRRSLVNTYLTSRRRPRWSREVLAAEVPEAASEPDRFAAFDLQDMLARLLPALPVRQRTALILRYYEDLTEAQTAELMGCSTGTVKSQTSKALAKLRISGAGETEEMSQ